MTAIDEDTKPQPVWLSGWSSWGESAYHVMSQKSWSQARASIIKEIVTRKGEVETNGEEWHELHAAHMTAENAITDEPFEAGPASGLTFFVQSGRTAQ